jgi:transposase
MPRRSELSVEQRREAVLALLRKEEPGAQLARRFGVSEQTLYRWRDEFLAGGEAALAGSKNGSAEKSRAKELRAQLEERDLVIGLLAAGSCLHSSFAASKLTGYVRGHPHSVRHRARRPARRRGAAATGLR